MMCEQILTDKEIIEWHEKTIVSLSKLNGKNNKKLGEYAGIFMELRKVRSFQKHDNYDEKCPEDIKAEYNETLKKLVDDLLDS